MTNTLVKTTKMAHLTQEGWKNGARTHEYNGIQIDRRIYTDGTDEFIKINGFTFKLYELSKNWHLDFIWES